MAWTSDPQNFLPCSPPLPLVPKPSQSLERTAGAWGPFALPTLGANPAHIVLDGTLPGLPEEPEIRSLYAQRRPYLKPIFRRWRAIQSR